MKKQNNLFKFPLFTLILIFAITLGSCTMVKSGDVNNFQKVKYHPHLKGIKSNPSEKLVINSIDKKGSGDIQSFSTRKISSVDLAVKNKVVEKDYINLKSEQTKEIIPKGNYEAIVASKMQSNYGKMMFHNNWSDLLPLAVNLNEIQPISRGSSSDISYIIWVILVVLLVLILISLLADLGGGLIGTLIAVLLILLILRLLGII